MSKSNESVGRNINLSFYLTDADSHSNSFDGVKIQRDSTLGRQQDTVCSISYHDVPHSLHSRCTDTKTDPTLKYTVLGILCSK